MNQNDTYPEIIIAGSINTDLVVKCSRLPSPGETVTGGSFFKTAGGKGANQAVAAARLSKNPVLFISAVGDDLFGKESLEALSGENLDCRFIKTVTGAPSGIALINVDEEGENSISVASGANFHLNPEDIEAVDSDCFEKAKVFLVSLEIPVATVAASLKKAKEAGLRTILNPAPATTEILTHEILPYVDLLTPNEHELGLLSGFPTENEDDILQAGRYLIEQGVNMILCTRGKEGSIWFDQMGYKAVPAYSVQATDSTAAGDAFNGALATFFAEEVESIEASRKASAAAAISVTREGAQNSLPSRDELEEFLSKV